MRRVHCAALMSLAFIVAGVNSAARGDLLYGVTGAGSTASSLYRINTSTGAATLVGATGMSRITGLDFDPTTGILYGVSRGALESTLVTINKTTGAATVVGGLGITTNPATPDISFKSNGQLFGWSEATDSLISINKSTGTATALPNSVATVTSPRVGLAFAQNDTLYLKYSSDLWTLDATTGVGTFQTALTGPAGNFPVNALEYDGSSGILYSINSSGFGGGARPSFLSRIDPTTGTWAVVGDMGVPDMSALAFDSSAVPEPSTFVVPAIGLGALVAVRRRRLKANQPQSGGTSAI